MNPNHENTFDIHNDDDDDEPKQSSLERLKSRLRSQREREDQDKDADTLHSGVMWTRAKLEVPTKSRLEQKQKPDFSTIFAPVVRNETAPPDDDDEEEKPKVETEAVETTSTTAEASADANTEQDDWTPEDDAEATLTPGEGRLVFAQQTKEQKPRLAAEQTAATPDSVEEAQVNAVLRLIDKTEAILDSNPAVTPQEAIDLAANEVAAEIDPNINELPENDPSKPIIENASAPAEHFEGVPPGEEDTVNQPAPPAPPQPPYNGGGGGGGNPPSGPAVPFGPTGGGYSGGSPSFGNTVTRAANTLPDPNMIPIADALHYEKVAQLRGVLAGGLLGYLIGRRHGRLKSERKLKPLQQKLEKDVKTLETNLHFKEQQIREMTAEKVSAMSAANRHAAIERLRAAPVPVAEQRPFHATEAAAPAPISKPELAAELATVVPIAAELGTPAGPPAVSESQPIRAAEFVAPAEAAAISPTEHRVEAGPVTAENIGDMSSQQLLAGSEKVMIEGTSLRTIYEARSISEPGLRRVMNEYLRRGDVKKVLNEELLLKQMAYERDPQMRDRTGHVQNSAPQNNDTTSAPVQAQQALPPLQMDTLLPAHTEPPSLVPALRDTATQQSGDARPSTEKLLIRVWGVAIAILSIIALFLLFR